ncbi:MAG: T9SS type A sorting domain-containing protein [Chitinophagaceae bacterium]|nr:T9SS type A sorting domain-containing protein [Chitinophagaceae bacterium]
MKRFSNATCALALLFASLTVKAQIPKLNSYPQQTQAAIFLDFDGQTVTSPYWTSTPFYATPAVLTIDQVTRIFNQVSEDYRPFNINITTDSTVYFATPFTKRQRVIITDYSSWYGSAGGVAWTNSFRWGLEVPAFVFSNLLNNNAKNVAEASSHEAGHSLGLEHQKTYNASCALIAEYNSGIGTGEIGWAPIMGSSYSRNLSLWHNGTSGSCSSFQDDIATIAGSANGFGLRTDDIGNTTSQAATVTITGSTFATSGIINNTNDVDVFRFNFSQNGRLTLNAIPFNIAGGFQSANIDMKVELLNNAGVLLNQFNPSTTLQATIDSMLNTGTYFLRISNVSNANVSNYGMLGNYNISGSFQAGSTLPIYDLQLSARVNNSKHELDWNIIADEPIETIKIQISTDGRNFTSLQDVNGSLRQFSYQPLEKTKLFYRLHVTTASQLQYYSNIVSLRADRSNAKYNLNSNFINGNSIVVNSNGSYNWRLVDMSGRQFASGRMNTGYNRIDAAALSSGIYLLQIIDGTEMNTEKLVKQ